MEDAVADLISAEEGALKRGAQAVNTAKAGVDQQVKFVRGEIEQVRGYWSGAAAVSYTQLMARWDEETRKLNEVLVTLEEALAGTERDQAATEESHQSTISGLGSMMSS
jgi:WXG100 family type VII secretion target